MIHGQKVGLRAVEFRDLEQLLEWRNRPDYRRFFRENRELNFDQQKTWFFEKVIKDQSTRMFSIVRLEDGKLLGACGLCYIDWVNGNADFSIYIGHDGLYIDDDYAHRAGDLLIQYAFNEIRLHRLWCEVYSFDTQKQLLLQRLGFQVDGRHRQTYWQDGQWNDSIFFSLLETD